MFFEGVGGASDDSALDSAKKIMNLVDNSFMGIGPGGVNVGPLK